MWFDAIHSFHDTIQMWFDNIQILIQNPHDALGNQKSPTGLAWVAYHKPIDWLRLGVKLKLEFACVEINMTKRFRFLIQKITNREGRCGVLEG